MTPRYKPYPKYKLSGVEWLGEVPETWGNQRVGFLFNRTKRTGHKDEELLSVYRDHGVVLKNSRDDNHNKPSEDLSAYQLVCKGDLVLNKMKTWQGSIAISEYQGIVSPAYFVYSQASNLKGLCDPKYLHLLLRSPQYISQYLRYSKGIRVNQWDLDPDGFKLINALLPSLPEQRAIASFLDRETGKIDRLIGKQERMIELLKEKRRAVISHAVTKGLPAAAAAQAGLNPNAPMKDSGVEWIGEIPENWKVGKIGYYGTVQNGTTPSKANPEYWNTHDVPWLTSGTVNQYIITEASEYISKKALLECSLNYLPKGTVVLGMIGQGKTRGMSAITSIEATINQNLAAVVLGERAVPTYLHYVLQSGYKELREDGRGGNQAALNCEIIGAFKIPIPTIGEQKDIAQFLEIETTKIDVLTAKAEQAIELMKERRTALISAAVTGKIDVRGKA